MPGMGLHSLWGCVVDPYSENPELKQIERPYRVTSASLQSFHSHTTPRVAIYLSRSEDEKPLQIALLSVDDSTVSLDLVFKQGDKVAFIKKCIMGTCDAEVQLMGHYLDDCDACTLKKMSPLSIGDKKLLVLPAEKESVSFGEGMITIFVEENMEILIKKRQTDNVDKIKMEKEKLEKDLKSSEQLVEKLYSQVEELTMRVKYLEDHKE